MHYTRNAHRNQRSKTMILDSIIKRKKERVQQAKKDFPIDWLGRSLPYNPYVPRPFLESLHAPNLNIIAEVKKASPSKGIIRENFEPLSIAQMYEAHGAAAISVLTEEDFFLGSLEYLSAIKRFVRVPILRKDFIFDEYQIVESAVYGADSLLLIASILSKKELRTLIDTSRRFGIEPLVEIHDKTELIKAVAAGADMIGINHRNLHDFSIDKELSKNLIPLIPKGKTIIAESGLCEHAQLQDLRAHGVHAFLIGEFLVKHDCVGNALDSLLKPDKGAIFN